jgi:hypothetical protein
MAGTTGTGSIPMRAPNDNSTSSRPLLMRVLVRSWEYRHLRVWVRVRVACALFNLALAALLLASGQWLGGLALLGLIPFAGAALIFWTSARLQQSAHA